LKFILTQSSRDRLLFDSLKNYLDCGICSVTSDSSTVYLTVNKFVNMTEKIIPFFDKYPLVGAKAKDYFDFKQVAELMETKVHLTQEGFERIKQIKVPAFRPGGGGRPSGAGMNKGREISELDLKEPT
jgi:hypothetical protein